jgi:hypothetical protein
VLSITKKTPTKEGPDFGVLLVDATVGALALIAIIPLALTLGGFSFFLPWLIVTAPLMFAAGLVRGSSPGNIWFKGVWISLASLLFLACCANLLTFFLGMLALVLPALAGISIRRRHLVHHTNV